MLSDVTFRAGPSELQRAGCENNIGQTWFKCMINSLQLRKDTLTIRWLLWTGARRTQVYRCLPVLLNLSDQVISLIF